MVGPEQLSSKPVSMHNKEKVCYFSLDCQPLSHLHLGREKGGILISQGIHAFNAPYFKHLLGGVIITTLGNLNT